MLTPTAFPRRVSQEFVVTGALIRPGTFGITRKRKPRIQDALELTSNFSPGRYRYLRDPWRTLSKNPQVSYSSIILKLLLMQRVVRGYRESSLSQRTFQSMQGYLNALFMPFLSNIKSRPSFSSLHAEATVISPRWIFFTKICSNETEAYLIKAIMSTAPREKIVIESNIEVDVTKQSIKIIR